MTVQELIEELQKVEDKTQDVCFSCGMILSGIECPDYTDAVVLKDWRDERRRRPLYVHGVDCTKE